MRQFQDLLLVKYTAQKEVSIGLYLSYLIFL